MKILTPSARTSRNRGNDIVHDIDAFKQFGGIASAKLDYELASFVRISFLKHFKAGLEWVDRRKDKTWHVFNKIYSENTRNYASVISKCNIFLTYSPSAYEYAMVKLDEEGLQSAQALYHNLNSLESRP